MENTEASLERFHPLVRDWFLERVGTPTGAQAQAWRLIAEGRHTLVSAPTGSGKTLTAFLWALNRLIEGEMETGRTRVLYVSPLKALNNDIHRNLKTPLRELSEYFAAAVQPFPEIRAATRSGDTDSSARRRMIHSPPEILITTPESFHLLLSSRSGRGILSTVETVILDEIHAAAGTKRGVLLIAAVERLARLAGEFQRIALSATAKPLDTIAQFVGGYQQTGGLREPRYEPREVAVAASEEQKRYDISVRAPQKENGADGYADDDFWEPYIHEFRKIIERNRSTLFFANSRRLCERIVSKLNEGAEEPVAYSHHGSLSRETREAVEARLKSGRLKAIVATSSLEMGIDIGALDETALIQSPHSISSAVQRIGRASHQVGQTSRASFFPTHGRDFIGAAVLARAAMEGAVEDTRPILCPLDILAQIIVSMTAMETWDIDALYHFLRTAHSYRRLEREPFDAVLNMLAGRYEETRIRELKPRVTIDRLQNSVSARPGAVQTLYMSGGAIPDRGYFHLRHIDTGARIGELDEEYVWEREVGSVFTLGAQSWKIERITNNDVLVSPSAGRSDDMPFWRSEKVNRDFHFSERIGRFLESAEERLSAAENALKEDGGNESADEAFPAELQAEYAMEPEAAEALAELLRRQRAAAGKLPSRRHLLVERVEAGVQGMPIEQTILHTLWGSRVNRPFALALEAAFEDAIGQRVETYAENDSVVLLSPFKMEAAELLSLVSAETAEELLRKRLEGSGFFGARFRECAGRALLVTRARIGQRMPLWMTRLRSKKLMESVKKYPDFPILLEAWRACLRDEFDMEALKLLLRELESGEIEWTEARTANGSPFAQTSAWRQISDHYMYAGDDPTGASSSNLRGDLLALVAFTPGLRPGAPRETIALLEEKLQRTAPGYAPDSARALADWAVDRGMIPLEEWRTLLSRIREETDIDADLLVAEAAERLARIRRLVVPLEQAEALSAALYPDAKEPLLPIADGLPPPEPPGLPLEEDPDNALVTALGNWAQFYGPFTESFARETLGAGRRRLHAALQTLLDDDALIAGQLVAGESERFLCDAQNFETLLRMARAAAVPSFEPLPFERIALFLAQTQGLTEPSSGDAGLFRAVRQLFAYPARADMWESEIFPARVTDYQPALLDALAQEQEDGLRWIGFEGRRAAFAYEDEIDLAQPDAAQPPASSNASDSPDDSSKSSAEAWFQDPRAKYSFSGLMMNSGLGLSDFTEALWSAVWSGRVAADTFAALRKGAESRFSVPGNAASKLQTGASGRFSLRRGGRSARTRVSPHPPGNWRLLPPPQPEIDLVAAEERRKERVRALLDRYGILFRELLKRELPHFQWAELFRTLRIMELSGEVLSGVFFHGIPGLQFISKPAFAALKAPMADDAVYWMSAADPASLCGLQLEAAKGMLPRRTADAHLSYRGSELALASRRQGKTLEIRVPPDDARLPLYFAPLKHLLTRRSRPLPRIHVEEINGAPARESPYVEPMRACFDVSVEYESVALHRRYG